ncbi:MAG TPA: nicotinate-nucleotide adenylyltransferase [Longimicrobiales bacterium]|nr:nicotinate-nucleotide adenylyltransferase [Longimicrobiales bacterium]
MRTGIFGGTFDPPHTGHLIVAQDAALALELDRILFVPAAEPPHKQHMSVTRAALRVRMLELALTDDDRFAVDTVELERSGPSYTVDTLRELGERWPGTDWTLLMGVDQYATFHTWRQPDDIRRLCRIAVLSRDGLMTPAGTEGARLAKAAGPASIAALPTGDVLVSVTRIDISSTAVRERVGAGQPIRYLVPAAVEALIVAEQLYSRNGPESAG